MQLARNVDHVNLHIVNSVVVWRISSTYTACLAHLNRNSVNMGSVSHTLDALEMPGGGGKWLYAAVHQQLESVGAKVWERGS